jgi:RNA polymerase sigma-70 factor, ECF subfamily
LGNRTKNEQLLGWKMNDYFCYTAVVKRQPQFCFEVHTNNKVTPEELSDELVMARVAQGDITALETLYDRHAATILGIALKIIGDRAAAEDVLQETFWKAWQSAGTFQIQHGSFRGWLFKITRNLAIDAYRRRGARPQRVTEPVGADPGPGQIPFPNMGIPEQDQSRHKAQEVRNALTKLPSESRHVIELAYFYGMTQQEIAESTGVTPDTIHARARLGLKKLREELERGKGFDG